MDIKKTETKSSRVTITLSESDVEAIIAKRLIELGHIDERYKFNIELQCRENYFDACFVTQDIDLVKDEE
jgi:hypothetical protein